MKKINQMIQRSTSIITGKKNLELLYSQKNVPVFFGCTDQSIDEDYFADMDWGIDPNSGIIQLLKLIPLDVLYQEQHVDGCGSIWQKYYSDFSAFISGCNPGDTLEIGGGKGILAHRVTDELPSIHWTIIEPNPLVAENERISVIRGLFQDGIISRKFDSVVLSQVLEHIYDPIPFLKTVSNVLHPQGSLIIGYPNLKLWLERCYTNALNFEHTMFLTADLLDFLLLKAGFKIIKKERYNDHSFFYFTKFIGNSDNTIKHENYYVEYKKIFLNYINYYRSLIVDLNGQLKNSRYPIYLFGGHIFSQFLISFGLDTSHIRCILDNSDLKQGRRLYGTHLMVRSPKILSEDKNGAIVILKCGIYNNEIKEDILKNINSNVTFIE